MPTYEFACTACGFEFEAMRKMLDPHLPNCARCQSSDVEKRVSASAFQLKGSGWAHDSYGVSAPTDTSSE